MLTQSDNVPEPSDSDQSRPHVSVGELGGQPMGHLPALRTRRWSAAACAVGLVLLLGVVAGTVSPSRWFIDKQRCTERNDAGDCTSSVTEPAEFALVPANAAPVEPLLHVSGTNVFADKGSIFFVTVREPRLTMLDWLAASRTPAAKLRSHFEKYGDRSPADVRQQGQRQMSGAKEWAIYVALTRAGLDAEFVAGAAVVDYVLCLEANEDGSDCVKYPPANDFLQPNDIIVDIDGTKVDTLPELGPLITSHRPGDVIEVTVQRDGQEVTGSVELIAAPDEPGRTIVGFMPIDTTTLRLPEGVDVEFDTGSIGGPSAGLAFTLSLLDSLTTGDLTGGIDVAVTGAIDPEGTVGAIGGLSAKAEAVRQMGVKYFLVPSAQPSEGFDSVAAAQAAVGDDVMLIPVATLDEALAALERLGGDPVVTTT